MSNNTPTKDIRTLGIVLKRTNYGEADRILSIITPNGKISVIAKGVRKPKSKLAGAVEMLTLSELMVHFGRSELGILTSAKMMQHFSELMLDYNKMTLAGDIMKRVNKLSESADTTKYFEITKQCLAGLNNGMNMEMVESFALLNLKQAAGEEINLYRDTLGEKLAVGTRYNWDGPEEAFHADENGEFGTDEIKMMRLITTMDLNVVNRVKTDNQVMPRILGLARRI